MHMMEMVLALFATVLFTTLSLTYNQAIWAQTDYLNNATTVVQASQICHSILDEVDAKLFSGQVKFNQIRSQYNFTSETNYPFLHTQYDVKREAVFCDKYGKTTKIEYDYDLGKEVEIPIDSSLYILVTVTVSGPTYLKHPYSLTRIVTETFVR